MLPSQITPLQTLKFQTINIHIFIIYYLERWQLEK